MHVNTVRAKWQLLVEVAYSRFGAVSETRGVGDPSLPVMPATGESGDLSARHQDGNNVFQVPASGGTNTSEMSRGRHPALVTGITACVPFAIRAGRSICKICRFDRGLLGE